MSVRLVLPFDGSPASQRAVDFLVGYAGRRGDLDVVLLNVQTRPFSLWPNASGAVGAIESALLQEGQALARSGTERLDAAAIPARAEVRLGLAAQAILHEAGVVQAEAIVMGTRGAGPVHGYALGSVALRVAHGGAVRAMTRPSAISSIAPLRISPRTLQRRSR